MINIEARRRLLKLLMDTPDDVPIVLQTDSSGDSETTANAGVTDVAAGVTPEEHFETGEDNGQEPDDYMRLLTDLHRVSDGGERILSSHAGVGAGAGTGRTWGTHPTVVQGRGGSPRYVGERPVIELDAMEILAEATRIDQRLIDLAIARVQIKKLQEQNQQLAQMLASETPHVHNEGDEQPREEATE